MCTAQFVRFTLPPDGSKRVESSRRQAETLWKQYSIGSPGRTELQAGKQEKMPTDGVLEPELTSEPPRIVERVNMNPGLPAEISSILSSVGSFLQSYGAGHVLSLGS